MPTACACTWQAVEPVAGTSVQPSVQPLGRRRSQSAPLAGCVLPSWQSSPAGVCPLALCYAAFRRHAHTTRPALIPSCACQSICDQPHASLKPTRHPCTCRQKPHPPSHTLPSTASMHRSASSLRWNVTYALPVGPFFCAWLNGVVRLMLIFLMRPYWPKYCLSASTCGRMQGAVQH